MDFLLTLAFWRDCTFLFSILSVADYKKKRINWFIHIYNSWPSQLHITDYVLCLNNCVNKSSILDWKTSNRRWRKTSNLILSRVLWEGGEEWVSQLLNSSLESCKWNKHDLKYIFIFIKCRRTILRRQLDKNITFHKIIAYGVAVNASKLENILPAILLVPIQDYTNPAY